MSVRARLLKKTAQSWSLALLCCLAFSTSSLAQQAPGWSRGQQSLALSYGDCVRRAPAALQAEGYRVDYAAGDFAVGVKQVHTAIVICSPAPDGKMLVHIVVASNGEGGGNERQCLQAQMEQPGASRCGGSATGAQASRWLYQDGGYTDTQVFYANGTAGSLSSADAKATWQVANGQLVVRWWNGWTNWYTWDPSAPRLSGVAIGPSGERHQITLTRQ